SVGVEEVVLVTDNCRELYEVARERWKGAQSPRVRVMENRFREHLEGEGMEAHTRAHGAVRRFGAGTARNSAVETIDSEIVAFLDDDAWAERTWLELMMTLYEDPSIVAATGPPQPAFESEAPEWYPESFYWVFGCGYAGLPDHVAPAKRIFGGNMSARRSALVAVGGFQSVDFDDIDICMRLLERYGERSVLHVPNALIHHYVPDDRATWRYFCRRTYFVNKEKVLAFREMGTAANLAAERDFVFRMLRQQLVLTLGQAAQGRAGALRSIGAMLIGTALAGFGHLHGRLDALRSG
ncbi:MAG TPA: glycosyltransferase, partial [Solirubrobacteraceae bacterium]|nr:glycosyltransferase [Solirubrobacteraceae bacterium]